MIRLLSLGGLMLVGICFAQVPDPTITTMISLNGYATIAGRLVAKADGPVGISVRNGNLMYSTLTDAEGRWGIVIRHAAVNVTVQSWDMKNPIDRSNDLVTEVR